MNFNEVLKEIETDLSIRLKNEPYLQSDSNAYAYVLSAIKWSLFKNLPQMIDDYFMPDTCVGETLERWCDLMGIERKKGEYAIGIANIKGTVNSNIKKDTLIQINGIFFKTVEDKTIDNSGACQVQIRSLEQQEINFNNDEGEIIDPQSGIDVFCNLTVNSGNKIESDEQLRQRFKEVAQSKPQGGAKADYIVWVKQSLNATAVWTSCTQPPNVKVFFLMENNRIPNNAEIDIVEKYLNKDNIKPITSNPIVVKPTPKVINLEIEIYSKNTDTRENVVNEINALFERKNKNRFEGSYIMRLSNITEAISLSSGEKYHKLISPTEDIEIRYNEYAKLGNIIWK